MFTSDQFLYDQKRDLSIAVSLGVAGIYFVLFIYINNNNNKQIIQQYFMLGWPSWSKAVDLSSSLFGGVGSNPTSSNIFVLLVVLL